MSASKRPRGGRRVPPSTQDDGSFPEPGATVTLICITFLLMAFSVVSWVLDNTTLAAVSGTGACTLAADIGRRLLNASGRHRTDHHEDDEPNHDGPDLPEREQADHDASDESDTPARGVR